MYAPAINIKIGKKICEGEFAQLDSLAFCLEDSITHDGVEEAEKRLVETLIYIREHCSNQIPMLFVRVRSCAQFERLPLLLGNLIDLLTGVIFPKFDTSNGEQYCELLKKINSSLNSPLFMMPILESESFINLKTRKNTLFETRRLLDEHKDYVLNVRVGAMDFCRLHGLRRNIDQSIYDIGIVRDVLIDILTTFSNDYIVSAPVWEYFEGKDSDDRWKKGLENELRLDITNGFIGKTVIHPTQIPVVKHWLKPTNLDYKDALDILNWQDVNLGVAKNTSGNRMNELATHVKWAKKILNMSKVYGVREQ